MNFGKSFSETKIAKQIHMYSKILLFDQFCRMLFPWNSVVSSTSKMFLLASGNCDCDATCVA